MRNLKTLFVVFLATFVLTCSARGVGFHAGPRVGVNLNDLHFNTHVFDRTNRVGYTAGLEMNLSFPLGIGIDASVMYTHRTVEGNFTWGGNQQLSGNKLDYINIPVMLEWGLYLPDVSKIFAPYVFTGPDFAFRVSKNGMEEAWNRRRADIAWNFGIGMQWFEHLRLSVAYGAGLTKYIWWTGLTENHINSTARINSWTVTAAYLF